MRGMRDGGKEWELRDGVKGRSGWGERCREKRGEVYNKEVPVVTSQIVRKETMSVRERVIYIDMYTYIYI
jgi:hypothetical protein